MKKEKEEVREAINVDSHTAVVVRNTMSGQLRLVTESQLFFPSEVEEIEAVQQKIVLDNHQVCIIKDKDGRYQFKEGKSAAREKEKEAWEANDKRSFFLPPYCQLVEVTWHQKTTSAPVKVTHFDLRPQFMSYKFVCRTTDNVELEVDLTFFWEISNIKKMIHMTDDLPSDICNHARSVIIQYVSVVSLEKFMNEFNQIIYNAVLGQPDVFYDERGCSVHTVEVRSIHCVDQNTEKVLQEIIKETTDRLNRLQKQASENEVRLFKMRGEIEEEKLNGELLRIRKDHRKAELVIEGEAQAEEIVSFFKGMDDQNIPFEEQYELWRAVRHRDAVSRLATSKAHMTFAPKSANLTLRNFQ